MFKQFGSWLQPRTLKSSPMLDGDTISATLREGLELRGYTLEKVLHRGGMSWVYVARDRRGLPVVIKEYCPHKIVSRHDSGSLIVPSDAADLYRDGFRRFHEEGRFLGIFRGPYFARSRSFFHHGNTGYIVLERERGRTLSSYLMLQDRRVRAWSEIQPFVLDIYCALREMHSVQVLHLDLHPGNIFLTLRRRGVLLDFGAARHMAEPILNTSRFYTPGFSAPEIKEGVRWGTWSDVYSFGACLRSVGALKQNDWPADVKDLVLHCLHTSLSDRILTLDDKRFDTLYRHN